MGALHATAWHLITQLGEVDVEVVVRWLVVDVDPQLGSWKVVTLQDGLLNYNYRDVIFYVFKLLDFKWTPRMIECLPFLSPICSAAAVDALTSGL